MSNGIPRVSANGLKGVKGKFRGGAQDLGGQHARYLPVSASAINGTVRSNEAIMPALSSMSFMVAMPRSAMPNLEAEVPAPVWAVR